MKRDYSRFPHGKRGLKFGITAAIGPLLMSLPPREAWIEILISLSTSPRITVASPTGSVD